MSAFQKTENSLSPWVTDFPWMPLLGQLNTQLHTFVLLLLLCCAPSATVYTKQLQLPSAQPMQCSSSPLRPSSLPYLVWLPWHPPPQSRTTPEAGYPPTTLTIHSHSSCCGKTEKSSDLVRHLGNIKEKTWFYINNIYILYICLLTYLHIFVCIVYYMLYIIYMFYICHIMYLLYYNIIYNNCNMNIMYNIFISY